MFGKGFKKTALISVSIAIMSVLLGVLISYIMNLAPGGTIVITSVTAYLVAMTTKYFKKKIMMWNGVARPNRTIR
jgi:zinc transport system permease protein